MFLSQIHQQQQIHIRSQQVIKMTEDDTQILCLKDFEKKAFKKLQKSTLGYYSAGADEQFTLKNNIQAFSKIKLLPRVLRDMSEVSLSTSILGQKLNLPFGVAPVAMQKLIHPQGQKLLAKQSYKQGTAYGLSMISTTKIKDISEVHPQGMKIHQVYLLRTAQYTEKFIRLVESHGFKALAITVDTQIFGKRKVDQYNKFQPDVVLEMLKELGVNVKFRSDNPQQSFIYNISTKITWQLIKMIKSLTNMKIILKGVVDPADIPIAEQIGVDAIWISNHGGRQLDTAPATIQALPGIKKAIIQIKSNMQIYIDGGIRKGSDIFKCLALGADFVFLGRGFLYSLIDGAQGVNKAFQILKKQLYTTMVLCGTKQIKEINSSYVLYKQPYSRL